MAEQQPGISTGNPEIDVTEFVNIDDKPFDIYINGKVARHLEAGEKQIIPVWVAQVGAKHLVDRVLQEKHNVKDTLRDSDIRRSLFAEILPKMAQERKIEPLKPEEFQKKIWERQEEQKKLIEELAGNVKKQSNVEETIAQLQNEIRALKMRLGRKQSQTEESPEKSA